MEIVARFKHTKVFFKVLFGMGLAIYALTFLMAVICGCIYPDALNIGFSSIFGLIDVALFLIGFEEGIRGHKDYMDDIDEGLKYSKENGKGSFEVVRNKRKHQSPELACVTLLLSSLFLPFVFFFSDEFRLLLCIKIALPTIFVGALLFVTVVIILASIQGSKDKKKEKAEAERLRREQESREQMGSWR